MQDMWHPSPTTFKPGRLWAEAIFGAKAVGRGGIVRRAVKDVEREIGRADFMAEVQARGYHLIECGGQFIVICNGGSLKVLC